MGEGMKLLDLEPRWVHPNLFVFRCPHCRQTWLTCKNIVMGHKEQIEILQRADLDPTGPRYAAVPMKPETAWKIRGKDFSTMTITPSIDASASGHWHGHITAGRIR